MRTRETLYRAAAAASLAALLTPGAAPAASAQNAAPQAAVQSPPAPAAPRSATLPKPVERTLKNGLRVIVVERAGVPLVTAQMLVRSGAEADPADKAGLANMTATLLTKGAGARTAPQIAEATESLGAELGSFAGWDGSSVVTNVMTSKLDADMAIFADVVLRPKFEEEELRRQRDQSLDALRVSLGQPGTIASWAATRVLFGETPYGHPASGTPESLERITREDVVRFHQTYYRPDNAVLVVGGDIRPDAAFAMAERLFGAWAKPATPLPAAPAAKVGDAKARVLVIDKPDAGQAAVLLVRPGLRRTDPDFYRGIVTNSLFGGGYSSRINQEVRIKRGLSYGAGSSLDVRRDVGPFVISTQTKNESGDEVASLFMSELTRLGTEPIVDAELTPRKAVLVGNFGRSLETTTGLVGRVAALAQYGVPVSEIDRYIQSVQAVSPADVQKFASGRIGAKESSLVIVGNASAFLEDLKKQFPNVEVIPVAEVDFNSPTLRKK